ncbi:MAG: type III pantothenate kinase [Mycoplasmataceae bacterium]|jgi:pantothenate kinase type III|nr:type III pantothenate kinase [Mycoplasmataceae bacterium]
MNKLIIDVGNTNIKLGNFIDGKLTKTKILPTKLYSFNNLKKKIDGVNYQQVYVGSVVKELDKQILRDIKNITKLQLKMIRAIDFKKEFNLSKFNVNEIGTDILGLATILKKLYKNAVGISFGTATFAVAVKCKRIMGVVIASSIEMGIHQLNTTTSLIKNKLLVDTAKASSLEFGKDTNSAINSGASHMARGFISSVYDYAKTKYHINQMVLTGGKTIYLHDIDKLKHIKLLDNAVLLGYYELSQTI